MARAKRRHHQANGNHSHAEHEMDDGQEEMENEIAEPMGEARRQVRRMQRSAFGAFDVFSGPMARLMEQNWSMVHKVVHAMQEESLHFVNRRLEHTSHAIESSRDCEGISGLLAIQQEWMVDLARDYAEQSRRFADLVRDLAEDGASTVSEASSEIAEHGRNKMEEESRRAAA